MMDFVPYFLMGGYGVSAYMDMDVERINQLLQCSKIWKGFTSGWKGGMITLNSNSFNVH